MSKFEDASVLELLNAKFKKHPWHGVSPGNDVPNKVMTFIEVVPTDTMKYEIDKDSGYVIIDRPQKFSNNFPALYGFIPKTYCAEKVAEFSGAKAGIKDLEGDHDPLDIVVLTDRHIPHADLLATAIPIGGFRMIDGGEADDKIIAVLEDDQSYGSFTEISDCPKPLLDRIMHYFLTYKEAPGKGKPEIEITHTYGAEEAKEVILKSMEDYNNHYGDVDKVLADKFQLV